MPSPIQRGSFDVAVIGGGPAGSAAARLLAHWGHSVAVLTKPESGSRSLAESLPPSCRKLFDVLGVTRSIDGAGFYRSTGNTVWWGDRQSRSEAFADGALGYQVLRRDFDHLLLDLAERAGALVVRDATVKTVDVGEQTTDSAVHDVRTSKAAAVRVEYERGAGGRHSSAATFALDCSGRAGVIARRGFRSHDREHATVALVGVWRSEAGWPLDDATHTLVEAYADGWAWSVPVSDAERYFTVMVDPRLTQLERGRDVRVVYQREIDKTREFSKLVGAGVMQAAPWGCDASLYAAHRFAGPHFLLVGDAASFIDPLSSFGVKKALASGWMAATVAHTVLTKPEMRESALELFSTREREVYSSYRRQSARHFHDAAREHQHPFWTGRFSAADQVDVEFGSLDVEHLRRDPAVLSAFEALKQSPVIELCPTSRLRMTRHPAIRGREVVLEDRIALPEVAGGPDSVRFIRGVDLPKLVEMATHHRHVPDLFEAYNRAYAPVALPDFLGALSVLLAAGVVENVQQQARKQAE